jgi:trimeric autotransporter adhesin
MSAQVTILQLPAAGAITGTESVPIVQNGVTVQTTTGAIASAPSQVYTYLTVNQTPQLPNSRYVGVTNGLSITDGGAQGLFNISTTGALLSLVNSGTGFQVKTSSTSITGRSIAVSGTGLAISNGDGIAGDPTITLAGQVLNLANASFNGFMVLTSAGAITSTTLVGTANQIGITNTNGVGNPVFSIADDAVFPGTGAITIPVGTTGQRPAGVIGKMRYNSTDGAYEGYSAGAWRQFSLSGGVTQVNTGTGLTGGPITGIGTISLANTAVTAGAYGSSTQVGTFTVNAQGQLTAAANVNISATAIGAITTINGTPNEIDATGTSTVTLSLPAALTFTGKTVTGGTFTGTTVTNATQTGGTINNASIGATTPSTGAFTTLSASVSGTVGGDTITTNTATQTLTNKTLTTPIIASISNTGLLTLPTSTDTLVGRATTDTLTNKTISGSNNTLTNIGNASLTNSSVTVGTTAIALGGSSLTLGGLTSVAVTQDPTTALQLATKQYVDTLAASGIHYHAPVFVESPDTAGNLNATYNQPGGAGDGVGATLTNAGTQAALVIDGVLMTVGKRVLIYNQTNQTQNGVYTVTVVGTVSTNWVLTRATDADTYAPFSPNSLGQGDAFFVQAGATGAGETYICNTVGTIVFGVTNITFVQLSSAQIYSAGTGLTLTGTVFSITNTAVTAGAYGSASTVPTFTVNAQGQLTLATNASIAIDGNQITSGTIGSAYLSGSYTGITGVGTLTAGTWNAGTIGVAYGGTNITSYTAGDLLYASGTSTLSKLTIGAANYVLTSSGTSPQYVAQSTLAVGSATNATNVGITANSTNADNYLTFVSATSGNLPELVNSSITCNPSTGAITGGISGGTF